MVLSYASEGSGWKLGKISSKKGLEVLEQDAQEVVVFKKWVDCTQNNYFISGYGENGLVVELDESFQPS